MKRLIFPVICFIAIIIFVILIGTVKHILIIGALFFNIISIIFEIFEKHIVDSNLKYYTEEYARIRLRIGMVVINIIAVCMVIAVYLVSRIGSI